MDRLTTTSHLSFAVPSTLPCVVIRPTPNRPGTGGGTGGLKRLSKFAVVTARNRGDPFSAVALHVLYRLGRMKNRVQKSMITIDDLRSLGIS